jgi:hypothetical protein
MKRTNTNRRTISLADESRWRANDAAARWLAKHDKAARKAKRTRKRKAS